MFKRVKNIISVLFSLVKFILIKIVRKREFSFRPIERFSPGTMINIHRGGYLKLGNRVRAHQGTKLSVTSGGTLEVGDDTAFNYNCIVVARKSIKIGTGVIFGPNVMIFDHDHDFRSSSIMNGSAFKEKNIVIDYYRSSLNEMHETIDELRLRKPGEKYYLSNIIK